jgi:hypothetical protein
MSVQKYRIRSINISANARFDVLMATVTNEFYILGCNDVQSEERQLLDYTSFYLRSYNSSYLQMFV